MCSQSVFTYVFKTKNSSPYSDVTSYNCYAYKNTDTVAEGCHTRFVALPPQNHTAFAHIPPLYVPPPPSAQKQSLRYETFPVCRNRRSPASTKISLYVNSESSTFVYVTPLIPLTGKTLFLHRRKLF